MLAPARPALVVLCVASATVVATILLGVALTWPRDYRHIATQVGLLVLWAYVMALVASARVEARRGVLRIVNVLTEWRVAAGSICEVGYLDGLAVTLHDGRVIHSSAYQNSLIHQFFPSRRFGAARRSILAWKRRVSDEDGDHRAADEAPARSLRRATWLGLLWALLAHQALSAALWIIHPLVSEALTGWLARHFG